MEKYRTIYGDVIEIEADFAQASCEVLGTNGRQVADFQHRPSKAMRYAVNRYAVECGEDIDDPAIQEAIDNAVADMEEVK